MVCGVKQDEGTVRTKDLDLLAERDCYCNGNNRRLWQIPQNVLGETDSDHTAEDFTAFFPGQGSVSPRVHHDYTTTQHGVQFRSTPTLECWSPVTMDEVEKLISSAPRKTCELDPAPTWLIKDVKLLLSPFIVLLFN